MVFQGNNVRDQDNDMAVFGDRASSASLMIAGKFIDVVVSLDGNTQEQSDAEKAYTQALLQGNETWIFLQRDQWPSLQTQTVCKLRLALYGQHLSGAFCEKHCDERLRKVGFERVPEGDSCYIHRKL